MEPSSPQLSFRQRLEVIAPSVWVLSQPVPGICVVLLSELSERHYWWVQTVRIPWLLSGPAIAIVALWLMDLPRDETISLVFVTFYVMPVSTMMVLLLLLWHPLILIGSLAVLVALALLGARLRLSREREWLSREP